MQNTYCKPKEVCHEKFFGLYLYSLVAHAPRQYEIVCLTSVNTENHERICQQAKQIALKCTNRKPENVIPSVMLRLQAKRMTGVLTNIYQSAKTWMECVACNVPNFSGTEVDNSFIANRSYSWKAYLKRISCYLLPSKVWWKTTPNGFAFKDGDSGEDFLVEGPSRSHFQSCSIQDIEKQSIEK